MLVRPLLRELSLLILLKIVALVVLFVAFFSPSQRPAHDAAATARVLLSTAPNAGTDAP